MKIDLPDSGFTDERGHIQNLTVSGCTSVAVITSKAGSVRAKHWHTDEHAAYVVSGKVEYWERHRTGVPEDGYSLPIQSPGERTTRAVYGPGDMFVSKPYVEHAMRFLEDSVIVTLATGVRSHDSHEAAVHRVDWKLPGEEA